MRLLLNFILLSLVSGIVQYFFGEYGLWAVFVLLFLFGFTSKSSKTVTFLIGLLSTGLVWGIYAYYLNAVNGGQLMAMIGELLPFTKSALQVLIFTIVIGGMIGGLSALSGRLAKDFI